MELMENFCLFAAIGKHKWQILVCLLQTEAETEVFFSLVSKRKTVIDDCCVSKCAHLC